MCRNATIRSVLLLTGACLAVAQTPGPQWRHIGNSAVERNLASLATGPVDRVWYSPEGARLFIRTHSGRVFSTGDFEHWLPVADASEPAQRDAADPATKPDTAWKLAAQAPGGRLYGIGRHAYRSDDGGQTWANLTNFKGASILGGPFLDLAASPQDADDLTVVSANGVWRSVDGGLSWTGLNDFLPNLPAGKLLATAAGSRGVRMALRTDGQDEVEWAPGEKAAWRLLDNSELRSEAAVKTGLSQILKRTITAIASGGTFVYAGDSEGRLLVTSDQGATWARFALADSGPVEAIWVDAKDARIAVAALGKHPISANLTSKAPLVLRTMNGGIFWDDITANLPDNVAAHGVTADRGSGVIYLATDAGVFTVTTDLASAGRTANWSLISTSLPAAPVYDVRLDPAANQLFISIDGFGVYAGMAPHRLREARLVSAADLTPRAAAPGSLLSVLGARVQSARTSLFTAVPVLAASDTSSQIQVPFEVKGNTVSLVLDAEAGRINLGVPLQSAAPAVFVDPDGTPMILDADSGVLLDAAKPAHSNTRIQALATGLGRVKPEWPSGVAGPLNDPPKVVAPVRAFLDGNPVEVTQAVLAPYIGYYIVEIQLPRIVNLGPAELYIEAEGQQSNRVRLYLEP